MGTDANSMARGAEEGAFGKRIMELADRLAQWSETSDGLTCTYLSPAHRAVAAEIRDWMRQAGLTTAIDAVGNVIGRYAAADPAAQDADRRARTTTPCATPANTTAGSASSPALVLVEHLQRLGRRLPFHLDVIAFSEEEGVRFSASFLGSSAVAGRFDPALLERRDADGHTLAATMREAGLDPAQIPALARRGEELVGYLEVHIEQGPVLLEEGLPVGIVSAIAGTVRSHGHDHRHRRAMPAPCRWRARHDAAAAAAEIVLYVERAARRRRPWSARSASSPSPTARSTSFPAAASSPSISAPPTMPRATPRSPTSWPRSRASRRGAASTS